MESGSLPFVCNDANFRTIYIELQQRVEDGNEKEANNVILKLINIFSQEDSYFSEYFYDNQILDCIAQCCWFDRSIELRESSLTLILAIIKSNKASLETIKSIVDIIAPLYENFEDPLIHYSFTILRYICDLSQDMQIKILATLQHASIAQIFLTKFDPDTQHEGFLFATSIFKYGTSDSFVKKIITALMEAPNDLDKAILISQITQTMPNSFQLFGDEQITDAMVGLFETGELEFIFAAVTILYKFIKYANDASSFDYSMLFSLFELKDIPIVTVAIKCIHRLGKKTPETFQYVLENGALDICLGYLAEEAPLAIMKEAVKFVSFAILHMNVTDIPNAIPLDFISSIAPMLEDDNCNYIAVILMALDALLKVPDESFSKAVWEKMDSEDLWETIEQLTSNEDVNIANNATIFYHSYINVVPPDEDLDF